MNSEEEPLSPCDGVDQDILGSRKKGLRFLDGPPQLLSRMKELFLSIQILGLYPLPLRRGKSLSGAFKYATMLLSWLGTMGINIFCVYLNIELIHILKREFGFLSTNSVTACVTGLKPLINVVNYSIFFVGIIKHKELLRQLVSMDSQFISEYEAMVDAVWLTRKFYCLLGFLFMVPFSTMGFEYIYQGCIPFQDPFTDFSMILVPLLTIWNVLPLLYFYVVTSLVRSWLSALRDALENDIDLRKRSLRIYYRQFLKLTLLLTQVGSLFNPFIFFTIGWTVFTLGLTIYAATQSEIMTSFDWNLTPLDVTNLIYYVFQVQLAFWYLVGMFAIGTSTNETARDVMEVVLRLTPAKPVPLDKYQVGCFIQKFNTQHIWGISVWRVVPMERTLTLTTGSMILTYGLLLMKMKEPDMEKEVAILAEKLSMTFGKISSTMNCSCLASDISANISTAIARVLLSDGKTY